MWSREKEMPVCAAQPLSPQFRRKAGTSRHIQTFKRCVEEFRRISVEYLKSEVRPWDSDVRRKIGQKYHSCGAKITCAASKLTCAVLISSVREEFYHWNFSKCNMYVRIINVQTGTHTRTPRGIIRKGCSRERFDWLPEESIQTAYRTPEFVF